VARHPDRTWTVWRALVPAAALAAGLLFATSANLSHGSDLRNEGTNGLVGLVRAAQGRVATNRATVADLDRQIKGQTDLAARSNSGVAAPRRRASELQSPAGMTALAGPGLTVVLDDAHGPSRDPSIDPNESVVHQSDLQAVVNSLWAGGAEAMSVAGQRMISTSAVRCVGNTLLLNGEVYSPPFRIAAIGPAAGMRAALGRSPGVRLYRQAAAVLGLRYTVRNEQNVRVPAYDGPVVTTSAKVLH
jgi:uncharacterized protein YlxW (UPF0749 family)